MFRPFRLVTSICSRYILYIGISRFRNTEGSTFFTAMVRHVHPHTSYGPATAEKRWVPSGNDCYGAIEHDDSTIEIVKFSYMNKMVEFPHQLCGTLPEGTSISFHGTDIPSACEMLLLAGTALPAPKGEGGHGAVRAAEAAGTGGSVGGEFDGESHRIFRGLIDMGDLETWCCFLTILMITCW